MAGVGATMRAVRPAAPGHPADLRLEEVPLPSCPPGQALVRVTAAGVNRSDVLACRGVLPGPFPRTLGRDYAGEVVEGPSAWVGRRVWGTGGGDLGLGRDGSHAEWISVPVDALTAMPDRWTAVQAAASGLAYFTAATALDRVGGVKPSSTVVVTGAAGAVGSVTAMIATAARARVVGIVKDAQEEVIARAAGLPAVVRSDVADVAARVRDLSDGGAQLAVDVVGGALTAEVLDGLAVGAGMCLLSSPSGRTPVDLLSFYRQDLRLVGLHTGRLTAEDAATVLTSLAIGIAAGALAPVAVHAVHPLDDAAAAYLNVERGVAGRPVLLADP